jgi:hypothetical protein
MFLVPADFDTMRVERFKQATEEKLRGVRCPEHHRPPRLRFQGVLLGEISISISGCCPKVMELANARIAAPPANPRAFRKPA